MTYRASQPFTCASCDVGIIGEPVFHVGLPFCCAGCAAGGPCMCSYDVREAESASRPAFHAVHTVDDVQDILDEPVTVDVPSLVGAAR